MRQLRGRNFWHLIKPFSENAVQQKIVNHLRLHYPDVLFTIGLLGIKLPPWAMWLLRVLGYENGTADIMIFRARKDFHGKDYHGLFIEVKREKLVYKENGKNKIIPAGTLMDSQKVFMKRAISEGYYAIVSYGDRVAIDTIDDYLKV